MAREVFAKGLKKYSFNTIEEELAAAWESPYRHWWAMLCCSKDYWWVCQQKGDTLDPRLRRVYEAFGDHCFKGFDRWWRFAARSKFVEQVSPESIQRIDSLKFIEESDFDDASNWMTLRVPLNISEAKLLSEFKELLRKHPNRTYKREQTSEFPIKRFRSLNLEVYRKAVEVWHAMNQIQNRRQRTEIKKNDADSLYEIGKRLELHPKLVIHSTDTNDRKSKKRNAMKVAVFRMYERAESLIKNVEIGIFPSYELVEQLPRWTKQQQAEMDKVIVEMKWQPLAMSHQQWAERFAQIHREEKVRRERDEQRSGERRERFMSKFHNLPNR